MSFYYVDVSLSLFHQYVIQVPMVSHPMQNVSLGNHWNQLKTITKTTSTLVKQNPTKILSQNSIADHSNVSVHK
jgi:hypothetical protein